jgi:predicted ABC-type transport system involved in lysophospholipase L1 biosynthesis ATPase subunit
MRKRAGLTRALALDPDILFSDEVSVGFDPITLSPLDNLIVNQRDGLRATVVVVRRRPVLHGNAPRQRRHWMGEAAAFKRQLAGCVARRGALS